MPNTLEGQGAVAGPPQAVGSVKHVLSVSPRRPADPTWDARERRSERLFGWKSNA